MTKPSRIVLLALAMVAAAAAPLRGEVKEWRIDAAHSYVGFKVRHMMVSWVRGRFTALEGKVWYDPANFQTAKVELQIDPASIDTGNEKRDSDLRGEEFFDVAKYPQIRFVSKKVEGDATSGLKVTGDLTLRGVSKEVVLHVEAPPPAVADGRGGEKTGVTATGKINRGDYELTWNVLLEAGGVTVSDEVTLEIEAELARGGPAAPAKKAGN